jgi:hypothetical protein
LHSNSANSSQLSAFDNNVIEGFDNYPPMRVTTTNSLKPLEKCDMTSDLTKNAKPYIEVSPSMSQEVTINQTTVPYYFINNFYINYTLTINEGVTVYMPDGKDFTPNGATFSGRLMVNGTASKKVKFTRLPSSSLYWGGIHFGGLKGSELNHCIFEYGGGGALYSAMFTLYSSTDLTLNNVEFNNSENYAVTLWNCTYKLKHSNVTFKNNAKGNISNRCPTPNVTLPHFP